MPPIVGLAASFQSRSVSGLSINSRNIQNFSTEEYKVLPTNTLLILQYAMYVTELTCLEFVCLETVPECDPAC